MDFFEAMENLKEGKSIRLKSWKSGDYIELTEKEIKKKGKKISQYEVVNQHGIELSPMVSFSALISSEWEVYNEDEKMKMAKKLVDLIKD